MKGSKMEKPPKISPVRIILSDDEKRNLTNEEFIEKWKAQEEYIKFIESRSDETVIDEKLKLQQQEATRRENVLLMRLATKEQEMQELLGQIQDLKQAQAPSTSQLQAMLIDPAVNLLFEKMKTELTETKDRLDQAQNDLSAWKFTPDSVTGKKLMAKCRMLIQENQDLGKQLSHGRIAQLESELALQRKYSEELKGSQDEMNDFVIQLDEEVEGMQATICALQEQLKASKTHSESLEEENQRLRKLTQDFQSSEELPLPTNLHNNTNGILSMDHEPVDIKDEKVDMTCDQHFSDTKDEFLDERTIQPSSNGDSNMSNASDELPMETEPSITLPQQNQNNLRTEDFQGTLEAAHRLSNHVKVICGKNDSATKDLEAQLHSFKSPIKGMPKTSFNITDLLASERTEPVIKKETDASMDVGLALKTEENGEILQHSSLNGEIDDSAV